MKKHNYFVTLLFGSAILLTASSCNEGDPKPEVIKPGADDLVNLVFEENLEGMKQTFSLNSETGGDIIGTQGTTIRFFANGFLKSNGDAVTGNVDVKLIELYKKSDMLFTKMPTQGKTDDGKIALLVSGGEFYINATQNGEQLKPNGNYMIIAPTETTGGEDTDMKPFEGVEECDNDGCEVVWKQQDRDIKIGAADGQGGLIESAYQVFQSQFGWTNIDRWYSDPRDKTTIFVDVPEGYDNTNCAVYLSYDGEGSALALFDTYNAGTGLFTEHYGLIPIGLEVHFIMVSVINDQWYYSIHSATIGANHVETFTSLQPTTEAELTALVDALP